MLTQKELDKTFTVSLIASTCQLLFAIYCFTFNNQSFFALIPALIWIAPFAKYTIELSTKTEYREQKPFIKVVRPVISK